MTTTIVLLTVLAGGFALGSVARLVFPGEGNLSLSATTVIGIAGAALGSFVTGLITGESAVSEFTVLGLVGSAIGAVIVLGTVIAVQQRFFPKTPAKQTAAELVKAGESATVEFKSTARVNLHTGDRDDRIEAAMAKSIAGFLNGQGGHLIIGVDDDGKPLGLERDLATMKQADHDRYALWLTDHLGRTVGTPALAFVTTTFELVGHSHVVHVHVEPSDRPVFVDTPKGSRTADFYVRVGNSTRKLLTDEFSEYRQTRWP